MKILHVIPSIDPESGGPAEALLTLVRLAKISGNEITVIATTEGEKSDKFRVHKAKLEEFSSVYLFPFFGVHSHKISPSLHRWLQSNISKFDLLHIHAAFSLTSSFAAKQALKRDIPYVFRPLGTLSGSSILHKSSLLKRLYYSFFEEKTVLGARVVHVTSRQEGESLQKLNAKRIQTVPVFTFENIPTESDSSKKDKIPDKLPILLGFLGRLHSKKNIDLLIQALKMLNFSEEKFRLRIAGKGDGKYIHRIKKLASELGVENYIDWVGFVSGEEKEAFFKEIDIFVSPSLHENFGIAAVEAMSRKVPCVLSRGHEFLSQSTTDNCVFCELSVVSVAKAITEIIEMDNNERSKMIKNGRKYIEKTFSVSSVSNQLQEMYESTIN